MHEYLLESCWTLLCVVVVHLPTRALIIHELTHNSLQKQTLEIVRKKRPLYESFYGQICGKWTKVTKLFNIPYTTTL